MNKNKNAQVLARQTWISYVSAIFLSLVFVLISLAVSFGVVFPQFSPNMAHADSTASINIWWPTDNFPMGGTQPFKAAVSGMDVSQYEMFWQVDNGQWNWMDSNNTDGPHKEASVNLSGWNWHGSGPYTVNFIARQNGNIISQKSVQIRLNTTQPAPTTSTNTSSAPVTTTAAPTQTKVILLQQNRQAIGERAAQLMLP
jgi:hypothetical protein